MRITIDTELRVIIVPNSYYAQIDRLNEIITAAGGTKLDYANYIRDCFDNAISTKIICQSEVAAEKALKKASAVSAAQKDENEL